MFYLGSSRIKGMQYTQCDMILNMLTKAGTWKSDNCYWARDSAQDNLFMFGGAKFGAISFLQRV